MQKKTKDFYEVIQIVSMVRPVLLYFCLTQFLSIFVMLLETCVSQN